MKRTRKDKNCRKASKKSYRRDPEPEAVMEFKLESFLKGYYHFLVKVNRYGLGYSV